MRLAWFRPATHVSDRFDDTAALVGALASQHDIHVVDETRAHDFVRLDFRTPFDLCVYELDDTPHHTYIWPYLLHVPGVLRLRSWSLHESRTHALRRRPDDLDSELAYSGWDLIGAPIVASRLTVVSDSQAAARLQRSYPMARLRSVPIGTWGQTRGQTPGLTPGLTPLVGSLGRTSVVRRAVGRAREAGAQLDLMPDAAPDRILDGADVIIVMSWPPTDDPTPILAAMATGKAVVAFETEMTAGWPALDPQTWQPRGWTGDRPILVTIDPRDEEHSLSLALRRLTSDPALRHALGTTAHEWWRQHATVDHAARAWQAILDEAASLMPPQRPDGWPSHLTADGTERARAILGEFAASVDFLR
jgi:hypothetical protein